MAAGAGWGKWMAAFMALIVLLLGLGGAFVLGTVHRSIDSGPRGVTVNGVGMVTGVPDQLRFNATDTHRADTVTTAMDQASAGVRKVRKALADAGVTKADIKTTDVSVEPTYDYTSGQEKITGYSSSQSLSVLARKLDKAGAVISAAASADGNSVRIGGISMDIGNKTELLAQARAKAIKSARIKATDFATAGGRKIDVLVSVDETSTTPAPAPYAYEPRALAATVGAKPVPISAGQQKLSVTVRVRWSLK